MKSLLTDFRTEFLDRLLDVLWRQWTAVGVLGHGRTWKGPPIDPDALLLFSCTVARYDARLFDAMLDWLTINGRYISVQRIKRMLKEEIFAGEMVLRAVAAATSTTDHQMKWKGLTSQSGPVRAREESLFLLKNGTPLPVVREPEHGFLAYGLLRDRLEARGVAAPFRPELRENVLLRLRAFLGVNARAEILQFLLLNRRGSPRAMAKDLYYSRAAVTKTLAEMSQSGFVVSRTEGRHRFYSLFPETWKELFVGEGPPPSWLVWARLFSALEQVWLFLDRRDLASRSELAQASSLRRILKASVGAQLARSGLSTAFRDDSAYPGQELIPHFVANMRTVLERAQEEELQSL
jgi:hypothetical protein